MNKTINQIKKIEDRIATLQAKVDAEARAAAEQIRVMRNAELTKVKMKNVPGFDYKVILSFKGREFIVTKDRRNFYVIKENGKVVNKALADYTNNVHSIRFAIAVGLV